MDPVPLSPPDCAPAKAQKLWPVRLGLALVVLVYLAYSSFGIAHPVLWGHFGHHTAEYTMRARMTLRFHLVTPATASGYELPDRSAYYFHHPIGYHHLLVLAMVLVGDHEWVAAALPALLGLVTLWALYVLVRRHWSREWGLVAVAIYVGFPILTSFSILTDPMLPTMACSLLFMHTFLNYLEAPSRRGLGIACLLVMIGGLLMWELYFQAFFHGLFALARLFTRRGRTSRLGRLGRLNASLVWFFATGFVAAATMAFHIIFVWQKGMMEDFLFSYRLRHAASIDWVVARHRQWLEILYGRPVMGLGLLWLGVFLVRAVLGRARARDHAVLIYFILNTFYIYLFAQGSAIHLYRVFFFSSFFALAVMDLLWELHRGLSWLLGRWPQAARWSSRLAVAAALAAYFVVEAPHAYANLLESRVMMGTHAQPWYNADYLKQLFAIEVARRTGPEDYVFIHRNLPHRIEFEYYLDRSNRNFATLGALPALLRERPRAVVLMDAYPAAGERRLMLDLIKEHPAYRFENFLMIDLRSGLRSGLGSQRPELREYDFQTERPSWRWRWFVSHHYPPMRARETLTAFGECLYAELRLPIPAGLPEAPVPSWRRGDQVLCHHNFLRLRDPQAAAAFRTALRSQLEARDVALGEFAHVLGLRMMGRAGGELWLALDRPPGVEVQLAWHLVPISDPIPGQPPGQPPGRSPNKTIEGRGLFRPLGGSPPSALHPGDLYVERLTWSVPPGRYRLQVDLIRPAQAVPPLLPPPGPRSPAQRPAPVPSAPPRPAPVPPPPPASILSTVDLGIVQLR